MADGDRERGLYNKYEVRRRDGRDQPGQKHEHCRLFVLDLDHDPFALPALAAYADACAAQYPALAMDLWRLLDERTIWASGPGGGDG